MRYDTGKHTVYYHRFHIVWITKYRYKVLHGALRERVRDIIRQVCEELGDKRIKCYILQNLGAFHIALGEYDKALDNLNKGLELSEQIGERRAAGLCNVTIGRLHLEKGDYKKAKSLVIE